MKKLLSLMLVLALTLSTFAFAGISTTSASEDTTIYFQVPEDWNNFMNVFCYIEEYGGDRLMGWQVKAAKCTAVEGQERLYSYDVSKVGGLQDGKFYLVIFSVNTGMQTYDLLLSSACYGDTAYCDGTKFEHPEDSNKTAIAAYWKNQNRSVYGPIMSITSIGNVVGTCLAPGETAEGLFTTFLTNGYLESAQEYSGKTDQVLIDDIINQLDIPANVASDIIKKSGVRLNLTWVEFMCITSCGEVTGTVLPPDKTAEDLFTEFLTNGNLENAQEYSGKTDQVLIDDIIYRLGITKEVAAKLIEKSDALLMWRKENSVAPPLLGDANEDGAVNVRDATTIQKHIASIPVNINTAIADADLNEIFNVRDATIIQKWVAGITVSSPIGQIYRPET